MGKFWRIRQIARLAKVFLSKSFPPKSNQYGEKALMYSAYTSLAKVFVKQHDGTIANHYIDIEYQC